jgi:hypothetical protein
VSIGIVPYAPEHAEAVRQFNLRLGAVAQYRKFVFPEAPSSNARGSDYLRCESFVALQDGAVRGGYLLRVRRFGFGGEVRSVAHCRLPVSEGVIDRTYSSLGMKLMRDASARHPLVFALGMGGMTYPLPRLLKALGWSLFPVPFYFKVLRPARWLRQIAVFRGTAMRRALSDAAAVTGLGWLGLKAAQARRRPAVRWEPASEFGPWADATWHDSAAGYAMIAERTGGSLNQMYPPSSPRFLRVKLGGENPQGWAVLLDTQMEGDRHFGNLRVGTIVDCLARPDRAEAPILAAAQALEDRGVDLIVSNQAHRRWGAALRKAGFLPAPSNFVFAASPQLAQALAPFETIRQEIHLNRGDGDGPINL